MVQDGAVWIGELCILIMIVKKSEIGLDGHSAIVHNSLFFSCKLTSMACLFFYRQMEFKFRYI